MPFTQSTIISVDPPQFGGGDMLLSWESSAPAGTWYQIYINRTLSWHGQQTRAHLPTPTDAVQIDIGSVDNASEATTDFAAEGALPNVPKLRAELEWEGGTFLGTGGDADVKGFRVYGEPSPGAGIDYTTLLGDIPAYTAGIVTDGFGDGGFGSGGFGMAGATYSWVSGVLSSGTWAFAVRSYDSGGNEGDPATTSVTILAPPAPPAIYPGTLDTRLTYTIDRLLSAPEASWSAPNVQVPGAFVPDAAGKVGVRIVEVTLNWLPSPG